MGAMSDLHVGGYVSGGSHFKPGLNRGPRFVYYPPSAPNGLCHEILYVTPCIYICVCRMSVLM